MRTLGRREEPFAKRMAIGLTRSTGRRQAPADAALRRLAYVAAETGARFVRDRLDGDPYEWLTTSKVFLDGRTPVAACLDLEGFRRAVAVHGLAIGLDCVPELIENIPASVFLAGLPQAELGLPGSAEPGRPEDDHHIAPALFTATIVADLGDTQVQIFCAMVVGSASVVRTRLLRRFGPLLEEQAEIRVGFDWSEPIACALVPPAVAHLMHLIAEEPSSSIASGFDFLVEQRFEHEL